MVRSPPHHINSRSCRRGSWRFSGDQATLRRFGLVFADNAKTACQRSQSSAWSRPKGRRRGNSLRLNVSFIIVDRMHITAR